MSFINEIKQRAKEQIKTIVLPEATDLRTLKAVDLISLLHLKIRVIYKWIF